MMSKMQESEIMVRFDRAKYLEQVATAVSLRGAKGHNQRNVINRRKTLVGGSTCVFHAR